jgi:hypothetical protein
MKTIIYSPIPPPNDYLTSVYTHSLYNYLNDLKKEVYLQHNDLTSISNANIIIDVTNLGSTYPIKDNNIISALKNNGNRILAFDINDHSSLGFCDMDISGIDFLFKIGGVQETDSCNELLIDPDCTYRTVPKEFYLANSINYTNYKWLKDNKRIMSLPYVMNDTEENVGLDYDSRIKKCSVRGGAHFKRIHLFFNLLKHGLADEGSAFFIKSYQHMLCTYCCNVVSSRDFTYDEYKKVSGYECANPAIRWQRNPPVLEWGEPPNPEDIFNKHRWAWNNRCHPIYYWLMEKFIARHGQIDTNIVSKALNNPQLGSSSQINEILGKYLFYGDFKWIFSIYIPQRFWHAARCRSINLLPSRAATQSYFPEMTDGNHFITFKEDFSDLEKLKSVTKEQWEHITNNCLDIYRKYIKWGKYKLSENLMDKILEKVE